jgi:hypothetical protein
MREPIAANNMIIVCFGDLTAKIADEQLNDPSSELKKNA